MADKPWTDEELRSAVTDYVQMRGLVLQGKTVNKSACYRALHEKHPNLSVKTFEIRFRNISYVYAQLGRQWIPGLLPAAHVGHECVSTH